VSKTVEQWLALGDDLPVELAKVFTPGPWKHGKMVKESGGLRHESFTGLCSLDVCPKCDKDWEWCEVHPCSVPDPIDIKDWNTAMEWREKIVNGVGFGQLCGPIFTYMHDIWEVRRGFYSEREWIEHMNLWWALYATAKDWLVLAAAMAVLRSIK